MMPERGSSILAERRRKLPIGQTFRELREENSTTSTRRPISGTRASTTSCRVRGALARASSSTPCVRGQEVLFEGPTSTVVWSVRYPVVRLSFGSGNFKEPGYLQTNLMAQLDAVERRVSLASEYATAGGFGRLIEALHDLAGQRVRQTDSGRLKAGYRPQTDYLRGTRGQRRAIKFIPQGSANSPK